MREHSGRAAFGVCLRGIGTRIQQQPHAGHTVTQGGKVKRAHVRFLSGHHLHVCIRRQQHAHRVEVGVPGRRVEGAAPPGVDRVDVGTALQQLDHQRCVSRLRRRDNLLTICCLSGLAPRGQPKVK
jgi:hypothetical protein